MQYQSYTRMKIIFGSSQIDRQVGKLISKSLNLSLTYLYIFLPIVTYNKPSTSLFLTIFSCRASSKSFYIYTIILGQSYCVCRCRYKIRRNRSIVYSYIVFCNISSILHHLIKLPINTVVFVY